MSNLDIRVDTDMVKFADAVQFQNKRPQLTHFQKHFSRVFLFFLSACDAPLSKLSIYTLHAPNDDCHALGEHDGAHDLSGPMPVGALSAESCMI